MAMVTFSCSRMTIIEFVQMYIQADNALARIEKGVTYEIIPVTMLAENWFEVYREYHSSLLLEERKVE